MVVMIMIILVTSGIYNIVIWTIESCSHSQSQMAFTTSIVIVNVVVNATSWCCVKTMNLDTFEDRNTKDHIVILKLLGF
jgi:hypothetical protein